MTKLTRLIVFSVLLPLIVSPIATTLAQPATVTSPDDHLRLTFHLSEQGRPEFNVEYHHVRIVAGALGLEFLGSGLLRDHMQLSSTSQSSRDRTYAIPVGKASTARDHHHELIVSLKENLPPYRKLDVVIRAFNDGVAFRYLIPEQEQIGGFIITDEHTQLSFPGGPKAKLLPLSSFKTSYEWYYDTQAIYELRSGQLIGLPMLLEHPRRIWLAVTEANLTDYAGMYLSAVRGQSGTLESRLSPLPNRNDQAKAIGKTPFATPWRVLMVADDPGRLIESNIVFNLNESSAIEDTSWIKPGKTTFPWWNHYVLEGVDFEPGVNTATMKHYIDFCARHGIEFHSLDGLDIAWYGGPIAPTGPTDVTKAAPSIDMSELLRHAKEKGVRLRLWMHWKALKPQLDQAFKTYEQWGIEGVMIDFMDRDDQEMVRWYHKVARKAAEHHLTVTWHGAYKPTGMERTWPNVLSYEAALNQEYNKWQPPGVKGTPPSHNLDIAFVRMLAGPLDYHQGGMRNVLPQDYRFRDVAPPVQGTRAHQLAMYVVYQNHLPMIADYPQAYEGQTGFEFIIQVPTTWDETRVLRAELDDCLVIARRKGRDWYLGGMTADNEQVLDLDLNFLGEGTFVAELYQDDPHQGPRAVTQRTQTTRPSDHLQVVMAPSGGFVARLVNKYP